MALSELRESLSDINLKEWVKGAFSSLRQKLSSKEKMRTPDSSEILSIGMRGKYGSFREICRAKVHEELLEIEVGLFEEFGFLSKVFGGNPFEEEGSRGMLEDKQDILRSYLRDLVKEGHVKLEEYVIDETKDVLKEKLRLSDM
jgi:hypothetical protein